MTIPPVLDKFILVVTNWVAIAPILFSDNWRDSLLIGAASFFSILHHSVEVIHYGPPLIHASKRTQWFFLQADRFFATLATIAMASQRQVEEQWFIIGTAFLAGAISEQIMRGKNHKSDERRLVRVILHSYWHLMMGGYIAYMAVTRYSGEERFIDIVRRSLTE